MLDLISMWTKPKMVAFTALTAVLYAALLYPAWRFDFFGQADYFRFAAGVPVAFSFLFGPAAAWGAAIGNLICDASTVGISTISLFGFVGNFFVAYIPYKLWSALTAEKADLRSVKKFSLFVGVAAVGCTLCGLIIAWGLLWLYGLPFSMDFFTIALTDLMWSVIVGAVVLAASYGFVSRHKLLYTDMLSLPMVQPSWGKGRSLALAAFAVSAVLCFFVGLATEDLAVLLGFTAVSIVASVIACR
jgi:energy-coupling factor transport system substrate-specific component